jgi:hypothetical protein
MSRQLLTRLLALVLAACFAGAAGAHKPSDAYLQLEVQGSTVQARVDVALRDLDRELVLDSDEDGELRWGEVRPRWAEIDSLVQANVSLSVAGRACTAGPVGPAQLDQHTDGVYAVLTRTWQCPDAADAVQVGYGLFAQSDPTHRGVLRLRAAAGERVQVLVPSALDDVRAGAGTPSTHEERPVGFLAFVLEGMHHILIGTDHVLFLLALLLPAVLVRVHPQVKRPFGWQATWVAAARARDVAVSVAKVVTAFTVAHSITLALAVLDVYNPPSRWVESIIAASVIVAAWNNLWPLMTEDRWKMTFVFGLVHGFGFASVLKDLGLSQGGLLSSLLGFNLGVELGQLAVVAVVLPVAWVLRGTRFYPRWVLRGGSWLIVLLAGIWLAERLFDLKLLGGG